MKEKLLFIMNVDWNWIKQRPHFIAEELNDKYDLTIVYQYKYGRSGLQKRDDAKLNLKPVYLIPKISGVERLRGINDKLLACKVKALIKKTKPKYVFLTYPTQVSMIPKGYEGKVIYDCMDNHIAFMSNQKKIENMKKQEEALIHRSDYVLVSSMNLQHKLVEQYNMEKEKSFLIRNAFNGELLNEINNKETDQNEKFKIAYFGTLSSWFDWDVIQKSLSSIENLEYHLYGPVDKTQVVEAPGVYYHGTVEHSELHNHVKDMDCLLMPFVVNEIVEGVDPVKLYEYINFNKNILVCYYDEIKRFEKFVHFYNNSDEYCDIITNLMKDNSLKYSLENREVFLKDNDWQSRAEKILSILN